MMQWSMCCVVAVAACATATPSKNYDCRVNSDCDSGRVCDMGGFCVVAPIDAAIENPADAAHAEDAAVVRAIDAAIDAGPVSMTFAVGATACNNSRCEGGYNGQKEPAKGPPTADKLCSDKMFTRSTDFTISTAQPGGAFCFWTTAVMAFQCDGSCSGCNAITSITCTKP